jgi:hypothetical protein
MRHHHFELGCARLFAIALSAHESRRQVAGIVTCNVPIARTVGCAPKAFISVQWMAVSAEVC